MSVPEVVVIVICTLIMLAVILRVWIAFLSTLNSDL